MNCVDPRLAVPRIVTVEVELGFRLRLCKKDSGLTATSTASTATWHLELGLLLGLPGKSRWRALRGQILKLIAHSDGNTITLQSRGISACRSKAFVGRCRA